MTEALEGLLDVFDQAALEQFIADLVVAGFSRDPRHGQRRWIGPAHPAFARLTDATEMVIRLDDGWPVTQPAVFVAGVNGEHTTVGGHICLWQDDEPEVQWARWADIDARITVWCEAAIAGWRPQDRLLDAWASFERRDAHLLLVDLPSLPSARDGIASQLRINLDDDQTWSLEAGRPARAQLSATWYPRTDSIGPPRTLEEFKAALTPAQRTNLERNLARRRAVTAGTPSGGLDVAILTWIREDGQDVLAVVFNGDDGAVTASSLQVAPSDNDSRLLRAGPDAKALLAKRVAVIGCGALGSHTAVLLGSSGVGALGLSDSDVLLPGNVVRHAGDDILVGYDKTAVTRSRVVHSAPWCDVTTVGRLGGPTAVREFIAGVDLVIDGTGDTRLSRFIGPIASDAGVPLLSGALYRGGAVARIRRQALPGDTPLQARAGDSRYLPLAAGDAQEEFAARELGCSALIHNAPPAAVVAAASLMVRVAVDILMDRARQADEYVEVYRPLESPFHRPGLMELP